MGFTWTQEDLPVLVDPNMIDRIGHFMHEHHGNGYVFEMPVVGYQIL